MVDGTARNNRGKIGGLSAFLSEAGGVKSLILTIKANSARGIGPSEVSMVDGTARKNRGKIGVVSAFLRARGGR
jgi:hypothetical protein